MKFGSNSKVYMMGKGQAIIQTKPNATQTISYVFLVLEQKINLLSISQWQEKSYEVSVKDGVC